MAHFFTFTSTSMTTDKLWGTWNGTFVASPSEYRVFLTDGTTVRYLNSDNSFTYSGGPATQQPTGGNYTSIEIISVSGPNVFVHASLSNFGAQPLTSVFSDPDATVLVGAYILQGNSGNDTLRGFGGDDTLYNSVGVDQLYGGDGSDLFHLNPFDGPQPGEIVDGGTGGTNVDRLNVDAVLYFIPYTFVSIEGLLFSGTGTSAATIDGGQIGGGALSSALALTGSAANDSLFIVLTTTTSLDLSGFTFSNWSATDILSVQGDGSAELVVGSEGNDRIQGNGGADQIFAEGGNDIFFWNSGETGMILNGGDGIDELAGAFFGSFEDVTLSSIERLSFYSTGAANGVIFTASQIGDSQLTGEAQLSSTLAVTGSALIDQIQVNMGSDTDVDLSGFTFTSWDAVADKIAISGDADSESMIGSSQADTIMGGGGDDTLIGEAGSDQLNGGTNGAAGDWASYTGSSIGIVVDLLTNANFGGDAAGDSLSGIENVTGSGQSDILLGGIDNNVLEGGGGADFIFGRFGADTIRGGADGDTLFGDDASGFPDGTPGILIGADSIYGEGGNDNIYGEGGADFIDGGADIDTANYSTSPFGISVFLQSGQGFGPTGSYAAGDTFANIENVVGTAFNDQIFGNASANTLEGAGGSDTMAGSLGSDILVGGADADSFVFSSVSEGGPGGDIITDFTDNVDVLDLRTLFTAHGLSTTNPVGSGVLIVRALGPGSPHTEIAIDLDGSAGGGPAFNIATLLNITPGLLSVGTDILVA